MGSSVMGKNADRVYQRATQLLEAEVSDELVALEPNRGICFGFNSIAADVWRKLARPRTFLDLKTELLAEYDVSEADCSRDLLALLDQMQQAQLIECTVRANTRD
jgi:hypothetical protein